MRLYHSLAVIIVHVPLYPVMKFCIFSNRKMQFNRIWCNTQYRLSKIFSKSKIRSYSSWNSSIPRQIGPYLKIHPNVSHAVKNNLPVVALESTIITHGMPYPENYRTALEVENILRDKDVVPATIAIINGIVHVGLNDADLLTLSTLKISRRGLPSSVAFQRTGGTTVSATMLIAHWSGIPIFVTGGVGGVHRGAESTMDISADLTELGRTPITVVSAGVKSILDIPKTLEYLETQGVTVATFGDNDDFPAFFTPKSGFKSQINIKTPLEAAKLIHVSKSLKMESGCLITAPIPEEHAAAGSVIEDAIQKSLVEAESLSVTGAEVTPFILKRVNEITGGESLKANIALIKHNAAVGADIAVELSRIQADSRKSKQQITRGPVPVVIGATSVDIISKTESDVLFDGPSNPADTSCTLGGVGRNIAENLSRMDDAPTFLTVVGEDRLGNMAEVEMSEYLDVSYVHKITDHSTGIYLGVMDQDGSLRVGTENFKINDKFGIDIIRKYEQIISSAPLVCIDANLPEKTIEYTCDLCWSSATKLFLEPTGSLKAHRPFVGDSWKAINYLTPNLKEFQVIMSAIMGRGTLDFNENVECSPTMLRSMLATCRPLVEHVTCLIVTLGTNGVATFIQDEKQGVIGRHYPLSSMPDLKILRQPIINVSGSGDSFAAAFIHGLLKDRSIDVCTKMGLIASQYSLRSQSAVSPVLSAKVLQGVEDFKWESQPIYV